MPNQPVLTGFPCTVFATAKRRLLSAMRRRRLSAIRDSICGYALLFEPFLAPSFVRRIDPTRRNRHFGHIPVLWAWVAQILDANASCSKALNHIQAWYRAAGLPAPTGGTGGYCQARGRMCLRFLDAVLGRACESLSRRVRPGDLWRGHVVKAIDGSSVHLIDTAPNQEAFPQPGAQAPGCGFPTMGIVGILNLCHGGWEGIASCPHTAHDSTLAGRLLKHVGEGEILLGDRAFCTYEIAALLRRKGAHAVMRLHQARHAKLDWRKGRRLGPIERLVQWVKPAAQPAGSKLPPGEWDALPGRLTLRYIKLGYEDRGGCKRALVVVTTLLDAEAYEALEVAGLYGRRWDIEVKLRDIKTTLGMERFEVRSPEMAERTLRVMMVAVNLLRGLMQEAAAEARVPLWHISFAGVLGQAAASHGGCLLHRGQPRNMARHRKEIIAACATKILDIRPSRHEPRAVKRRPKNYPLLTKPRHIFREAPHRGKPRRAA